MKKFIFSLMVAFASLATADAQVYLGGSFTLVNDGDNDATLFTIKPEIGYDLNSKWAIGTEIGFTHFMSNNYFNFAPYAHYSFLERKIVRLFVDGGVGISVNPDNTGAEIGFKPGLAIAIGEHLSFVTKYGFLGYRNDYLGSSVSGISLSSENLSLGFHYKF